jgi:hypothetical protein
MLQITLTKRSVGLLGATLRMPMFYLSGGAVYPRIAEDELQRYA